MLSNFILRFVRTIVSVLCILAPVAAASDPLPLPTGDVILTMTGPMSAGNTPEGAIFDIALLESLGTASFTTSTQWNEGVSEYKGISLHRLLEAIGAEATALEVIAINEYQVDVPTSDAVVDGPILAWERDGKLLAVREKGPLWLIYPYDKVEAYRTEEIYARSVWQVEKINLLP